MSELQSTATFLPSPPFHHVDGIHNLRDIGGYAISPTTSVRRGFLFRSAHLCTAPSSSTTHLVDSRLDSRLDSLGIKAIYDFRSDPETLRSPSHDFSGTSRTHVPVFRDQDASPDSLALRYSHYASDDGPAGFTRAYREILRSAAQTGAYRTVFEHIRDRPADPLLFHCSAGKDRTGVFAALALSVAGVVDRDVIGAEYELTEAGLGALREEFVARLMENPAMQGDRRAAERMVSAKAAAIVTTLAWMDEAYGGVEGYMKNSLGFTDDDIRIIRKNLVVEQKAIL